MSYPEFLSRDILAFPLVKILLSYVNNPLLFDRFASVMGDLAFEYMANEKDRVTVILDLAQEFSLKLDVVSNDSQSFFRIPLSQYLSFPLQDAQLHLVNQSVHEGKVSLSVNAASRWLAEAVHHSVRSSLPVDTNGLPSFFSESASSVSDALSALRSQESRALSGEIRFDAFPPCMEKLHGEIASGVNIPHMARFDLATFLININMSTAQVVDVFSKAANFDERVTRYHVENLSGKETGKKYSVPSCAKIREHGLCVSRTCNVGHPLQFYRREALRDTEEKTESDSSSSSK